MLLYFNMKKILNILIITFIAFTFLACGSTPVVEEKIEKVPLEEVAVIEEVQPIIEEEEEVQLVIDDDPVISEIDNDEYLRSTKKVSAEEISKEQFAKDKAEVLRKIEELQIIEETMDYESWINYISPDSIEFYSQPRHLIRTNKLKTEVLNGLNDYFTIIFIPSRRDGKVEEIRYNSPTSIKAVEVPEPGKIVTYYNFVKVDGEWFVELPKNIVLN